MKILVVLHSARSSGAELAAVQYITRWRQHDIEVVALEDGPIIGRLTEAGVNVTVIDRKRLSSVSRGSGVLARAGLSRLIGLGWALGRRDTADLVVAHSLKGALVGAPLARRRGVPFVWSVHDVISTAYMGRLNAVVLRWLVRLTASAVIVNSRTTLASLPTMRKPILLRPPGVSIPAAQRHQRSAPHDGCVIAMVGRLSPWKGQKLFLEAFASEFRGSTGVRALVIGAAQFGETAYVDELHDLVTQLGISGQVHFTGHVSDVLAQLSAADVLVHASLLAEPFGAVVIEGMAAGLAVVAADEGGPSEVISTRVDGILFRARDATSLQAALRMLARDPVLRSRLGRAASEAARRFDYERLAGQSSRWLEEVAVGTASVGLTDLLSAQD